jgi:hypothetical protein
MSDESNDLTRVDDPAETQAERERRMDDRWADSRLDDRAWWSTMRAEEEQEKMDRLTKRNQ